jgi:hypothetical protein
MKRFLFTILCATLLISCSDEIDLAGRDGTFEFFPNKFSEISIQDGFELYLIRGNTPTIKIEADENVVGHVKCDDKNETGVLRIYKEPAGVEFPSGVVVKITVTADSLDALILSSVKAQIIDTLRTDEIQIVCSDKSVLTGRLECQKIQSVVNNSIVEITGVSDTVQMNIDSGSSVKLFGLESNNAKVNISGGSFAEISVSNEFEVTAKEKSILHYRGKAIIRSLISADDSEIKKIN